MDGLPLCLSLLNLYGFYICQEHWGEPFMASVSVSTGEPLLVIARLGLTDAYSKQATPLYPYSIGQWTI